jgi:hypothetical protein
MTDFGKRARQWERENKAAAEIILADTKYQGIAREWAQRILQRSTIELRESAGPLFDQERVA